MIPNAMMNMTLIPVSRPVFWTVFTLPCKSAMFSVPVRPYSSTMPHSRIIVATRLIARYLMAPSIWAFSPPRINRENDEISTSSYQT